MISDVLSEAVSDIDKYLSNPVFDSVYEGQTREEVILVRGAMDMLRRRLDTVTPDLSGELTKAQAEITRLKRELNTRLTNLRDQETLVGIANVAHCGGQAGMTQDDALNAIRKLSLPHFDLNSTIADQMSEINRLKRLLNINYGKIGFTDDPNP